MFNFLSFTKFGEMIYNYVIEFCKVSHREFVKRVWIEANYIKSIFNYISRSRMTWKSRQNKLKEVLLLDERGSPNSPYKITLKQQNQSSLFSAHFSSLSVLLCKHAKNSRLSTFSSFPFTSFTATMWSCCY